MQTITMAIVFGTVAAAAMLGLVFLRRGQRPDARGQQECKCCFGSDGQYVSDAERRRTSDEAERSTRR